MNRKDEDERREEQERERLRRRTIIELHELLANARGIERLIAITDDEWERAALEGEGENAP